MRDRNPGGENGIRQIDESPRPVGRKPPAAGIVGTSHAKAIAHNSLDDTRVKRVISDLVSTQRDKVEAA